MCVGYKRIFCKFKETLAFSIILNLKKRYIFSGSMPPPIFSKSIEFKLPVKILCFSLLFIYLFCFSPLKCYKKSSWIEHLELPWWLGGKGSTCQCRGHGFDLRSGEMAHALGQLGLWATLLSLLSRAREPQLVGPHAAAPESRAR